VLIDVMVTKRCSAISLEMALSTGPSNSLRTSKPTIPASSLKSVDRISDPDGHAQERGHGRVIGREAKTFGVSTDVG
jgi:hypothetical protein